MRNEITIESLARTLDLTEDDLVKLAKRAPKLYRTSRKAKSSGIGYRTIHAPAKELKDLQKKLLNRILYGLPIDASIFGAAKGHSPKMAVIRHTQKPIVINADIADFFPSVKRNLVRKTLRNHGATADAAELLARLMTTENRLPQGAPTSTRMAALVISPMVRNLKNAISVVKDTDLTIWVDDATTSGPIGLRRLLPTLIRIIERHGFSVKSEKTKIMLSCQNQISLGIMLNNGLGLPPSFIEKYHRVREELPIDHPKRLGMESYMKSIYSTPSPRAPSV